MTSSTQSTTSVVRTTLNPNAAEFIPLSFGLGLSSAAASVTFSSSLGNAKLESKSSSYENHGKAVLKRNDSTNSSVSDDECRQYWRSQLPDDITPDFEFIGHDSGESFEFGKSGSGPSAVDYGDGSGVATQPSILRENVARDGHTENLFCDIREQGSSLLSGDSRFGQGPWEHQKLLAGNQERPASESDGSEAAYFNELVWKHSSDDLGEIDPVDLLANEFPGFASQSLADIYHANGGDLGLTIEMLTQLELQEEGVTSQHLQQLSPSSNLNIMDFPVLSRPDLVSGFSQLHGDVDGELPTSVQRVVDADNFFSSRSGVSGNSICATDFAAVVRKNTAGNQWPYERNGVDFSLGFSRNSSQTFGVGSFSGTSRVASGERFGQSSVSHHAQQIWLETGDAVANIYSELRGEARDHARIRNAFFEQARQAYLVGNKALAKELSLKGQWYNSLMKAAHNKAGEAIFRQRNLPLTQVQGMNQGQPQILDLHGLHVNEAIPLLKRELAALRITARSTQQRQQVFICVGTGHHTKGSRTPARLPAAVERYLAEENLTFTEPQSGMFRVILG
eukprot:c24999_g1_i1 orf=170-1864(+)